MKPLQALVLVSLVAGAAPAQAAQPPDPESRPNLAFHASGRLINALVQRCVDRTEDVEEEILGTIYYGLSRTLAKVRAELVPDPSRGSIELVMTGATYSDTLGFRGIYQMRSETTIPFEVRKRIAVDARQIHICPATAAAIAESDIVRLGTICKGCWLGKIVACCKAFNDQPLAEFITAERARCRLAERFDEDVYVELVRGHRALADLLDTARGLGLTPRPFDWSTTADHASVKITGPGPNQSRDSSAPPAPPKAADLAVAVHESLFEDRAERALGGKTYNVQETAEALQKWLASIDDGLAGDFTRLKELTKLLQDLKLKL